MELWQQLLSDNLAVAAEAIEKFVNNQKTTDKREFARTAERVRLSKGMNMLISGVQPMI